MSWQQKVFTHLLELCYHIIYCRGEYKTVANALSRRPHLETLLAMLSPTHDWLASLQQWYSTHSNAKELLTQLSLDSASWPPFSLRQGVILYKERVWLGSNAALQTKAIAALHDRAVGSHSGIPATFAKVHKLFYCPSMHAAVC